MHTVSDRTQAHVLAFHVGVVRSRDLLVRAVRNRNVHLDGFRSLAGAIKARKEFAQKSGDAEDFEKKVRPVGRSLHSRNKLGSGRKNVESSSKDEDEDDEVPVFSKSFGGY